MDKLPATIRGLLATAVLPAVALYAASALSCNGGADSAGQFVHELRERERLEQDRAALRQMSETSQAIIGQLIAGQLSLREAAALLRDEDEARPQRLRLPAFKHFLHLPPEERYMRQLLLRVGQALQGDPRQGEIVRCLREELDRATARQAH